MIHVKDVVSCIAVFCGVVAASAGVEPVEVTTSPYGWLDIPGGEISLVVYLPGWSSPSVKADWAGADEDAANMTAAGSGRPFTVSLADGKEIFKGRACWEPRPDGSLAGKVRVDCVAAVELQCLALVANVSSPFASRLGASKASRYEIPIAGGRSLVLSFPETLPVYAQDSRPWGGGWTVRFFEPPNRRKFAPGDSVEWNVVVASSDGAPLKLTRGRPVTITEKSGWTRFDYKKDITPGSALDFSQMGLLDAPAGKHGWLKATGGRFEFEGMPGVEQRFYGVNLCFTANYLEHEDADILVERFARFGYNTIRIHHHDGDWFASDDNKDRLDYLIARAIEKGMYITTDLYVSRPVKWRDIGIDRAGEMDKSLYKTYIPLHDAAFRDWAEHSRSFLEHVNPYTGRAYKDEPGMPFIVLVNEGKLYMGWGSAKKMSDPVVVAAWREFGGKGAPPSQGVAGPDEVSARFDAWIGRRMWEKGSAFVRSLGCRALLSNDNNGRWHGEGQGLTPLYDYVDSHFYVDHPVFLETPWRLPSRCENCNPVITGKPPIFHRGWAKGASKPYTISEWNFSGPGRYRGMGGVLTGAFASEQEWDGLWRFTYSHSSRNLKDSPSLPPGNFDLATDPLMAAGDRAGICLYLRRDAAPGSLRLDIERGSMAVVSPRTCGGFVERGSMDAGPLSFSLSPCGGEAIVPATMWVSSLDDRPLVDSSRILLVHLTDVQGGGARYADESRRFLLHWGRGLLVENGAADVALRLSNPSAYTVFELDTAGNRLSEIPSRAADGSLRFTVSTCGKSGGRIYYEICRPGEHD